MTIPTLKLHTADYFDSLEKEEEQPTSSAHVEKSPRLERLVDSFRKLLALQDLNSINRSFLDSFLYGASRILVPEQYSASEITSFVLSLNTIYSKSFPEYSYQDPRECFLEWLISNSSDDHVVLPIENLERRLLGLSLRDKYRRVIVKGDVCSVGDGMKAGYLEVEGSVNVAGNHMVGGKLVIRGDCFEAGKYMVGGEIHIHGRVNQGSVGSWSKGGKIFLYGDYGSSRLPIGYGKCEICHKGKLIREEGKEIS